MESTCKRLQVVEGELCLHLSSMPYSMRVLGEDGETRRSAAAHCHKHAADSGAIPYRRLRRRPSVFVIP
jgi:hypothetical protein